MTDVIHGWFRLHSNCCSSVLLMTKECGARCALIIFTTRKWKAKSRREEIWQTCLSWIFLLIQARSASGNQLTPKWHAWTKRYNQIKTHLKRGGDLPSLETVTMMKNKKEKDIVERAKHGINMMVAERVTKTIRNGGVVLVVLLLSSSCWY